MNCIFLLYIFSQTRLGVAETFFVFFLFTDHIIVRSDTWCTGFICPFDFDCCLVYRIGLLWRVYVFGSRFYFLLKILLRFELFFVNDFSQVRSFGLCLRRRFLIGTHLLLWFSKLLNFIVEILTKFASLLR